MTMARPYRPPSAIYRLSTTLNKFNAAVLNPSNAYFNENGFRVTHEDRFRRIRENVYICLTSNYTGEIVIPDSRLIISNGHGFAD